MSKKLVAIAGLLLAIGGTAVMAQNLSAIGERKKILKGFGDATKEPAAMLRGEAKFDLASVQAALKTLTEGSQKLPALFPDDSKTGGDTAALPAIWEKKADFTAIYDKLGKDAQAAAGAIKDEATFKAEMPKVFANCGACHRTYKKKT